VTDVTTSDSDADRPRAKQKKEYSSKKNRVSSSEPELASENEEAPREGGDEQDEEYEIEDVIESQKGYFGDGKFGYFVKWKGYPSEDNSWVHEDDAVNAQDLITKYWENKRRASKGGPRKPVDAGKPKTGRKSTTVEETREPTPPAKKRGRPKKSDQEEQSEKDQEASSDDDDARAKKKPRKSQGASAKKVTKQLAEDEEMVTFGSMKKHMTIASWENLVETIDTIERGDEGDLYVYFKIKHSDVRMREVSRLCAQKFPQKLIKFYESNLRWRIDGEDAN
jgi:chromobox protein 5